ncbi:hypothetical protein HXZ94_00730 [Empedobacter falsenii]|uniref:hypothetical protein n=1 Tax=Empedobacter falsenii TaxID=343874 RepID=UPI002577ED19|nr:hypothetical protein [Empedobacter falsenii]MDM1297030.1 hypothetical protein [Empedobacter falsenii]MDM1316823.1 hypothetical protein [Empedobacter falsenii]
MKITLFTYSFLLFLSLNSCNLISERKEIKQHGINIQNSPLLQKETPNIPEDFLSGNWGYTHIYDDELQDFVEIDYSVDDEKRINFDNGRYTTDIFPEKKYTGNYVFISPYEVACLDNYDTKKISFFIKILDETNPNVLDIEIIKDSVKQQYKIAIDYR